MLSYRLLALMGAMLIAFPRAAAQDAPRLRTLLNNGATILVENLPKSTYASVQLFASNRYLGDEQSIHGFRHLFEHLVLKGRNKDIDARLEKQGIWMMGRTLRDAIQIEMTCAPDQIDISLATLKELFQPLQVTQKEINLEIEIMKQELALQSDSQRLGSSAWETAYGPQGLDPWGSLEDLAKATPEALIAIQQVAFSPRSLVIVISGPIDVEANTKKAKTLLQDLRDEPLTLRVARAAGAPGRQVIENAFGEARGARVPSFRDSRTAAALAAGLAVASRLDNAFLTYTPTSENGLIIVGKTDENGGVGTTIDELGDADAASLFPIGKLLARRWVERQLSSPSESAFARGLLLAQGASYSPEQMLQNIQALDWKQFLKGFAMFKKDNAEIAVGVRH